MFAHTMSNLGGGAVLVEACSVFFILRLSVKAQSGFVCATLCCHTCNVELGLKLSGQPYLSVVYQLYKLIHIIYFTLKFTG